MTPPLERRGLESRDFYTELRTAKRTKERRANIEIVRSGACHGPLRHDALYAPARPCSTGWNARASRRPRPSRPPSAAASRLFDLDWVDEEPRALVVAAAELYAAIAVSVGDDRLRR